VHANLHPASRQLGKPSTRNELHQLPHFDSLRNPPAYRADTSAGFSAEALRGSTSAAGNAKPWLLNVARKRYADAQHCRTEHAPARAAWGAQRPQVGDRGVLCRLELCTGSGCAPAGKKIHTCGLNFTNTSDETMRSGVGKSSQEAIANALKLTLRHVSDTFNAVEVKHIELTQYPWFFLARVNVCPYRIQQGAVLPIPDEALPLPATQRPRRLPVHSPELYPYFGSGNTYAQRNADLAQRFASEARNDDPANGIDSVDLSTSVACFSISGTHPRAQHCWIECAFGLMRLSRLPYQCFLFSLHPII